MNLAVKFWKDVENPRGLPGEWPAECREIGEASSFEPGWVVMASEVLEEHKSNHQAAYEAWAAANPPPEVP